MYLNSVSVFKTISVVISIIIYKNYVFRNNFKYLFRLVHYIVSREAVETEEQNSLTVNGGSGNTPEGANSNGVANALTHNGGSATTMSTSTSANNVNGISNGGSHSYNGGVGGDQHSMEDGDSHQRGEKEKPRRRNISALSSSVGSNGGEDIDELDDAQSMEYSAGGGLSVSLNGDSDVIIVGNGTAATNGEAMLKLGRECNGNDVDSNGCCPPPPTSAVINGGAGHHLDSRDSLESDKMVASSTSSEQESNMSQVSIPTSFRKHSRLPINKLRL